MFQNVFLEKVHRNVKNINIFADFTSIEKIAESRLEYVNNKKRWKMVFSTFFTLQYIKVFGSKFVDELFATF
jgi:hypothetical protein